MWARFSMRTRCHVLNAFPRKTDGSTGSNSREHSITLRPDGKFIASFKYYRQHVRPRASVRPGPLLNESYKGKFSVRGTEITFQPDPTKQRRKVPPIVGTINGDRMNLPYIVAEGQSKHPLRLDMKKQSNW